MEDSCSYIYVKHIVQDNAPGEKETRNDTLLHIGIASLHGSESIRRVCGVKLCTTKRSDTIRLFCRVPSHGNHHMALGPLQNARSRPIFGPGETNEPRSLLHPQGRGWFVFSP